MFSSDDYIVYGTTGVCKIVDIKKVKFGANAEREYYVIKPVYEKYSTIYAPTDNEEINLRPVMTVDEANKLVKAIPEGNTIWIDDKNLRKGKYEEIIREGDRKEIAKLIKTLYFHKKEQLKHGKKLNLADEKLMSEAEKLLHQELAVVLNIKLEDVLPFILGENIEEKAE